MQISEINFDGPLPIDSYGPGFFRLEGHVHQGPLVLMPGVLRPWDKPMDFGIFIENASLFDVLFFGTGKEIAPLPEDIATQLEQAGIGVEIMATPTACRTYNMLLAEGRRIAAALIPV
ncbi:MAG: hypothetical protein ACI861_000396 [Paracoccaceae bacterium]|jgi:uncharacterized protein